MAGATNSFEGGTHAVGVTTGNSGGGSGTALSDVSGLTYSTAQAAHGVLSGSCGTTGYGALPLSGSGTRWARMYIRATSWSNPGSIETMQMGWGAGKYFSAQPNGSGMLVLAYFNGSGKTTLATGVVAAATDQWIRLEMQASTPGTSPASVTARLYNTADSTGSPDSTVTASSVSITTGTWDQVLYGYTVTFGGSAHLDDFGWSDEDWLGPILPSAPTTPPMPQTAVHRASRF